MTGRQQSHLLAFRIKHQLFIFNQHTSRGGDDQMKPPTAQMPTVSCKSNLNNCNMDKMKKNINSN